MNVAMWGRALRVIPRVTKQEWAELDVVSRWLIATRSAVLVMTVISAVIAGLLAYRDGLFDARALRRDHAGPDAGPRHQQHRERLDGPRKGVDKDNYFRSQYGPQPLEHGLMTPRELIRYAVVTGGLALAAGGYLVWQRGNAILTLLAIGAFFVLFYTWPLKYIGMGEPAVLLVWGPLMVGGSYYVISGRFDWNVALASFPFALGSTAVLFGKHIDKLEADSGKKIRTLPVLLGERTSRWVTLGMFVAQYASWCS